MASPERNRQVVTFTGLLLINQLIISGNSINSESQQLFVLQIEIYKKMCKF